MNKCIFSLYIDIDEDKFDRDKDLEKNILTKNQLSTHYNFLVDTHKKYALDCQADYHIFRNDDQYKQYEKYFLENHPYISHYNILNFYKIHLLYDLSSKYDEVVYFDLDIVPMTSESIFDLNFEKNGIAVRVNHEKDSNMYLRELKPEKIYQQEKWFEKTQRTHSVRSPTAKYWNCRAMLIESGYSGDNDVYNTGIVGAHRDHLEKLGYFDNFENDISLMHSLTREEGMWPNYIKSRFGYDNETLMSYKMILNNVEKLDLDDTWHYIMNNWSYIPNTAKLVHVINKDIEYAKKKYEEINF